MYNKKEFQEMKKATNISLFSNQNTLLKRSAYTDLFEEVFSAPYHSLMKEEEIHPLGAGSVGGIKLILDAHTMTNRIDDYKKGFSSFN